MIETKHSYTNMIIALTKTNSMMTAFRQIKVNPSNDQK